MGPIPFALHTHTQGHMHTLSTCPNKSSGGSRLWSQGYRRMSGLMHTVISIRAEDNLKALSTHINTKTNCKLNENTRHKFKRKQ